MTDTSWKDTCPPDIVPYLALANDGREPETDQHWLDALILAVRAGDDGACISLTMGLAIVADNPVDMFVALMAALRTHVVQAGHNPDGMCRMIMAYSFPVVCDIARGNDVWGAHGLNDIPRPLYRAEAV